MKRMKVIELYDFPDHLKEEVSDKLYNSRGTCSWYPGDGHFKPLSEVRNMENVLFLDDDNENTPDVYVYEKGDDKVGDWLMENHEIELCEEVLIK